ncbi:MAG TPA: hypothetical protein VN903_01605 [Polyangia bacterium]|nr:hypothetical protein [Polyangia bacterium]
MRTRGAIAAVWLAGNVGVGVGLPGVARAADAPPVPALTDAAASEVAPPGDEAAVEEPATGASPQVAPLVVTGYVDVGFAKAQGNGTSFHPADTRSPLDYGVDPFAPAINSRGEVASTDPGTDANGNPRFVNGFLPRSAGIGGTPSFLINTANVDFRYTAAELPVLVFTRVQLVPRLENTGETTRVFLEQAFGRITPVKSAELAVSIGKFDSVFGIEYLDNQANFRIGITPSLFARYTTGTSVGAKLFYRYQIIPIASALSLNVSATNSGTFVESLQGSSRSLTGVPVVAARVGYELNLARLSVKVGASAERGPRNDQNDRGTMQTLLGADLRVFVAGLSLSGEFVRVDEDEGNPSKLTGLGMYTFTSDFYASGFWAQAAYELPLPIAPFRITPYGRYEQRHGEFVSFASIIVDRITGGINIGIGDNLIVKGEYLINRELRGAPTVANNVVTSSVVWTW